MGRTVSAVRPAFLSIAAERRQDRAVKIQLKKKGAAV
jgi:hypothetical protein